ncbi:MAG: hypothetical protein ACYC69_16780 [Thermodesulfovibrionales bacterium]
MTEPNKSTTPDSGRIPEPERREERLAALMLGGLALLNFPLLSIFSVGGFVFGIPVFYFYLFSAWALIAGLTAFVLRSRPAGPPSARDRKGPGDS